MLLQRLLKFFMLIGLSGLLVLLVIKEKLVSKVVARAVVLFSKYRALLPYILAQAELETNSFTSKVYLTDHNQFGMKWTNGRRGQVATKGLLSPEGDYYAHYETDTASILDLLKWFDYKNFPVSVASSNAYAVELKIRKYFGAPLDQYQKLLALKLK